MSRIQRIIFTEASLEHALSAVRGLHDMSTELIAADVFRQMSKLATYRLTPVTIWCGPGGLYMSRLDAIANGEQQTAPAILIGTPDELIEDAHLERDRAIAESKRLQALLDERCALLDHWLQLANVCDDRNTDLMRETRAMLDGASPAWSKAASDLLAERRRQIELKGYNSEHDDHYGCEELTAYAVAHALLATGTARDWDHLGSICTWEVKDDEPRRMLIKAAALLLAALESLDRQPIREVLP